MAGRDGRELARANDLRVLKSLFKFGWLRTRDIGALLWTPSRRRGGGDLRLEPLVVSATALRLAQRTLARLRRDRKVIQASAIDGSTIYALSEAGARQLVGMGIPAKSGKDHVRQVSQPYFHHRRVANELAILGTLQGYRVASEHEIATGAWLGGSKGIHGKKPDVLIRDGKEVWWIEVERSRKTRSETTKLLDFLNTVWAHGASHAGPAELPGGYRLMKIVFVCNVAFINRLKNDLNRVGWTDDQLAQRIAHFQWLYVSEAKYILKRSTNRATPESSAPA